MTDLNTLIERVRGLEGPDREVDAEIDVVVFGGETVWTPTRYTNEQFPASRRPSKHHVGGFENEHVPTYTASLDAVVSLIERELPEWTISIEAKDGIGLDCYLIGPNYRDDTGEGGSKPFGGKPLVLCLLLATLTAIKEQRND
jgi:hypothetical protein